MFALALAALCPVARAEDPGAWNVRDHIPLDEVVVMTHRGIGSEGPEGTIETFREAWSRGFGPEADIRRTKDGVFVSFHDRNFARILPDASDELKKKGVKDLTLEEARQLYVGAYKGERFQGARIATLGEIVEELKKDPKRVIFCDIKDVDLKRFAEETREVRPQVCLAGPDPAVLAEWKRLAPDAKALVWFSSAATRDGKSLDSGLAALRDAGYPGLDYIQIHVVSDKGEPTKPSWDDLARYAAECRAVGVVLQAYPAKNGRGDRVETYRPILDAGVEALATDYPTVTKKALEEYYAEKTGK